MKVLMVCKGNICRSPMAEAILAYKAHVAGQSIIVDSAGTASFHINEAYDARTLQTLQKHDISFSGRARQFSVSDFECYDWIFVLDDENLRALTEQFGYSSEKHTNVRKITMMSERYKNQDVPDPYYGQDEDFELAYQLLEESLTGLLRCLFNGVLRGADV